MKRSRPQGRAQSIVSSVITAARGRAWLDDREDVWTPLTVLTSLLCVVRVETPRCGSAAAAWALWRRTFNSRDRVNAAPVTRVA